MKALNILIIEDNKDHLYFIKKALNSKKYKLKIIEDGTVAYNYLLNPDIPPDIVLLDQYLPNMRGCEILEKLGSKKERYKFIFMSVDNSSDAFYHAKKLGCITCIEKGANIIHELPKVVEQVSKLVLP